MNESIPPANPDTHIRLVATADWQIGMLGGSFSPAAAQLLRDTRIASIERILTTAKTVGAEAILAAGDLFEFPDQPQEAVSAVAQVLQRHRDVPIHAIPGNHDLYGPGTVWERPEIKGVDHFVVHHEDDAVQLREGVTLWSLPVRSKHDINRQEDRLSLVQDSPGVHIVMAHGHDTAYLDLKHEDCKLPIDSAAVIGKGYDLVVLGHWHSWNAVSDRVLYPGTHEQTKHGERDAGQVAIIDLPLNGDPPVFYAHRIGQIRWRKERFNCTGQRLPEAIEAHVRELSTDTDFLEFTLVGDIPLKDALDALPRARAAITPMLTAVTWRDETREQINLEQVIAQSELPQGLRQVQEVLLQELVDAGDNRERVDALRAELEVLYEVARDVGVFETGQRP